MYSAMYSRRHNAYSTCTVYMYTVTIIVHQQHNTEELPGIVTVTQSYIGE